MCDHLVLNQSSFVHNCSHRGMSKHEYIKSQLCFQSCDPHLMQIEV